MVKLGMRLSALGGTQYPLLNLTCFVVLIGWVPLLLLTILQGVLTGDAAAKMFLSDVAVFSRSFIAAPLLILSIETCPPRLTQIARHFRDSGILAAQDLGRFDQASSVTLRWSNLSGVDIATVALSYMIILTLLRDIPLAALPPWYAARSGGGFAGYSLAGWWHNLISLPLLLVLIFGWIWRVAIWARFLYRVSRLDLRLVPAHPDRTAGLKFVGYSVQAFSPVALAFGFIVAGASANRILYGGAAVASMKLILVMLVASVILLFAGPLIVFFPHLLRAWRQGVFQYGVIAAELGRTFENKWFNRERPIDTSALEVPDFSATTDLYQVASNVYEVRLFPTGLMSLGMLAVAAVAPFAVIALLFVPTDVVINEVIDLFF